MPGLVPTLQWTIVAVVYQEYEYYCLVSIAAAGVADLWQTSNWSVLEGNN